MLLRKNIYGQILSKEIINNEYQYKVAYNDRIYTLYCPLEPKFDYNYKDTVYVTYKRSSILWGKKIPVFMSKNLIEVEIKTAKPTLFSFAFDIVAAFSFVYLISKSFSAYLHNILVDGVLSESELIFSVIFIFLYLAFLIYSLVLFSKIGKESCLFDVLFNKQYYKNDKVLFYKKYIKDNFSIKEQILNKKLDDEERRNLEKTVNEMDYSITEKIVVSDIVSQPILTIADIRNIELTRVKKEIEAKEEAYKI